MIIEKLDGTRPKIDGLIPLSFRVESPPPRHTVEDSEGRNGSVDFETTSGPRSITGRFGILAHDDIDYRLLRNEAYRLFNSKEPFYLIDKKEPKKRWKVKAASAFQPEKLNAEVGEFEVPFTSFYPYAESIGTTQDPFTFDADLWQIGQGLIMEDLIYTHTTNRFQIFNAGDVTIDPREIPLLVEFTGSSNNLTITNNSTGDVWRYNGSSGESDVIQIDGIRSLKNGSSIFRDTNKNLITIAPGWNDFSISGSTDFTISFDFRFYYV